MTDREIFERALREIDELLSNAEDAYWQGDPPVSWIAAARDVIENLGLQKETV